jgi:hypothetical protein
VVPKQKTAAVDVVLQSGKSALGGADLTRSLVTSTSTVSEIVSADREEQVMKKASGQIVVYNAFSSAPQRLIKNTRFEASDGRVYRIDASIVVPGLTTQGGVKLPGSIVVTVFADTPGPSYNLPLSSLKGDFTIPGFKGTDRYHGFYARQKTDIAGGFSGTARVVDEATLLAVVNRLKAQLGESLWNTTTKALPPGYITFRSLYTVDYTTTSEDNPVGKGVNVSVTAVGRSVAFEALAFSHFVAQRALGDFDGNPVMIKNMEDVDVSPRIASSEAPWSTDPLVFTVKGNLHFVWYFDQEKFKADLAGQSKKDTATIMRRYSAIEKAEVIIKPSWLSKYPSNVKKIHLVLSYNP